jgi:osmotically inducible protein OsmC
MALSAELGKANITPQSVDTKCTLTFEKTDKGFAVTESHLDVKARIPGGNRAAFDKAAADAKAGCPISRLLNTKITMNATLES